MFVVYFSFFFIEFFYIFFIGLFLRNCEVCYFLGKIYFLKIRGFSFVVFLFGCSGGKKIEMKHMKLLHNP